MFERCLYFNINALTLTINQVWESAYAEFDLSPSHAYLLRLIAEKPGLTPKQISQELKLEKSTVTRFLNALEKKKMLNRKYGQNADAREQAIFPTSKTIKFIGSLNETGDQLYKKMSKAIGHNELKLLVSQLRQIETDIK